MKKILKSAALQMAAWLKRDRKSKVFYYHDVHNCNEPTSPMSTPLSLFLKHLEVLENEGFRIVSKIQNPQNEAMITFDDGFRGLFENFDTFSKKEIPITLFVLSGRLGKERYINENEMRLMHRSGLVTIGSHTVSHRNLDELTPEERKIEMADSKKRLEDLLDVDVDSLCYPRGRFSAHIAEEAKQCGYKLQYSCIPGAFYEEVMPGVVRRNFVQHATPREMGAWALGGGSVFENRFRKLHIREGV